MGGAGREGAVLQESGAGVLGLGQGSMVVVLPVPCSTRP
jgi:hypothetical protein